MECPSEKIIILIFVISITGMRCVKHIIMLHLSLTDINIMKIIILIMEKGGIRANQFYLNGTCKRKELVVPHLLTL